MSELYDIAILGAGPGGDQCGNLCSQGQIEGFVAG